MARTVTTNTRVLSSPASSVLFFALCLTTSGCGDDAPAPAPTVDAGPDLSVPRCTADIDCANSLFCDGIERCAPASPTANTRGCVAGAPACGAGSCDEGGATCPMGCPDADGDGSTSSSCGGEDCDDADATRYAGNVEACDAVGHDEDCDPATLGDDADGDGFFSVACCNLAPGGLVCGTDCDDTQSGVNPGSPESCNGLDDDCDGAIDERSDGTSMLLVCYADVDGDGFPNADVPSVSGCACGAGLTPTVPSSVATIDCDDASAGTRPGATEACNYADDDCDGEVDEGLVPSRTVTIIPEVLDPLRLRLSGHARSNTNEAWLTDEGVADDSGAAWIVEPMRVGVGAFHVEVQARVLAFGAAPTGGWSVVVAKAEPVGTDLGPPGDALGVPTDRVGLAIEWRFAGDGPDTSTVARIGLFGRSVLAGPTAVPPAESAMWLESSDGSAVVQRMIVEYVPDDLAAPGREERLTVTVPSADPTSGPLIDLRPSTSFLGYEFSPGELVRVGFTSSNGAAGPTRTYVSASTSRPAETFVSRSGVCF